MSQATNTLVHPPVTAEAEFRAHVLEGLGSEPKRISSRYFYDAQGDLIFQRIMAAPEYYLTRAEEEILRDQTDAVLNALCGTTGSFDLVELGAGDGTKTKHLLRHALATGRTPVYRPIDISPHVLEQLGDSLRQEMPDMRFEPIVAEYFQALQQLSSTKGQPKAILFLGSNIGNLDRTRAITMLRGIVEHLASGDRLMIGFDLKKDPDTIRSAYNDAGGHTRDFNLNLLTRMNRELGCDADLSKFMHAPMYDPASGCAKSHLLSTCDQVLHIPGAEAPIALRKWEAIHTEISQKYDSHMIQDLAESAGLRITAKFTDSKGHFTDVVFAIQH